MQNISESRHQAEDMLSAGSEQSIAEFMKTNTILTMGWAVW